MPIGGSPKYSPALGCDLVLDGWCSAHCPPSPDGVPMVARQSSSGVAFACYSSSALQQLETITFASETPPKLCGRKSSTDYVKAFKMMAEEVELQRAFAACVRNASAQPTTIGDTSTISRAITKDAESVLTRDDLVMRRAQLAALHQPLLRARPLELGQGGSEAAAQWLALDAHSSRVAALGGAALPGAPRGG